MALKYQFRCTKCEKVTDEWHSSGEAPQITLCKSCGEEAKRIWGFAKADTWSARHTGKKWENMRVQKAKQEYKQIDPKDW